MAGRIPQSFINDLLDRTDVVDVIDARITLKKAGKNYQALCPFHTEKTPSFSVSPDKQFYHCFGCGVSGTALTFLMEHDRLEFVEAVETLARLAGVEVPREAGSSRAMDNHSNLYTILGAAERVFRGKLKDSGDAIDYLRTRGLTGEVARDFGIGFAPDEWHTIGEALQGDSGISMDDLLEAGLLTRNEQGKTYDRFRGRIMFPIRDTRGRILGFGGRIIGDAKGPKYLNSPETPVFHKGRELYGLFEARKALRRIDRLIVVEGYMDVVALAQAGIANAVATLGTATTTDHFHKLYRYCDEAVCCFDGDAAGRQAAWRALENAMSTLTEGRQLKFMFLPDGEDPDSMVRAEGKSAFERRVSAASPALEYLFAQLSQGLDLANLDDQAKLVSLVMPFVERLPEGILQQLVRRRLTSLTGYVSAHTPVRQRSPARPAPPAATLSPLTRRLLRYALRAPQLVREVDEALKTAISELASADTFAEIIDYLDKNPGVDRSQILGRWAGQPIHTELAKLAQQPMELDVEAMRAEFSDGLQRYVALQARSKRRDLLAQMKEDPSREKLHRFWALKQSGKLSD